MENELKDRLYKIGNRVEEKAITGTYIKTLCNYQGRILEDLEEEIKGLQPSKHLSDIIADINTFNFMIEDFIKQTIEELYNIQSDLWNEIK